MRGKFLAVTTPFDLEITKTKRKNRKKKKQATTITPGKSSSNYLSTDKPQFDACPSQQNDQGEDTQRKFQPPWAWLEPS